MLTESSFLQALRRSRLLGPAQLNEIKVRLVLLHRDPEALAAELVRRGWLTQYQVDRLLEGQDEELVHGSYHVQTLVGEGGLCQVFKAVHSQTREVVALKVLHPELRTNPEVLAQFRQEMAAMAQLDHPNFLKVFDVDLTGNRFYFTMELVEGIDLHRLLQLVGRLPASQACDYVRQAALGLQYAYEHGLVHRDIKPANLLASFEERRLYILDIGLARKEWSFDDIEATPKPGQASALMGTADYIAPEQAINPHEANTRADIYSLGCTLYHLLTGQPPYPGRSLAKKLLDHQKAPIPSARQIRPELPPALDGILQRMMAKQPGDRYQTPAGVAVALRSFTLSEDDWLNIEQFRGKQLSRHDEDEEEAPARPEPPRPQAAAAPARPKPAAPSWVPGMPERRQEPRRAGNPVSVVVADPRGGEPVRGWVINRSAAGIAVLLDEAVEVGTTALIRPDGEQYAALGVPMKIIYCHAERASWRVGGQFVQKLAWRDLRLFG